MEKRKKKVCVVGITYISLVGSLSLLYSNFSLIIGDDVFSTETGLELGGIAGPVRCFRMSGSSTKVRNKEDRRGSPVASPMPKSVPSG